MLIPKKFRLGRSTYTVRTQPVMGSPPGAMAELDLLKHQITLAKKSSFTRRVFKREEVSDSFWHEVTHAILHDMGHPQWNDERFVTAFANRLNQVINTAEL
jgi:hypothetical protein